MIVMTTLVRTGPFRGRSLLSTLVPATAQPRTSDCNRRISIAARPNRQLAEAHCARECLRQDRTSKVRRLTCLDVDFVDVQPVVLVAYDEQSVVCAPLRLDEVGVSVAENATACAEIAASNVNLGGIPRLM